MGGAYGDSITVAPALTLTEKNIRSCAMPDRGAARDRRRTGGSNVQSRSIGGMADDRHRE